MDKRKRQLLDLLSDGNYYVAESIASQLNTGIKTARNLIRELNHELKGAAIQSKYGVGYCLQISDENQYQTYYRQNCLQQPDTYLPSTPEERIQYLFEYLFSRDTYVKLDDLSELLYISKRTLASDLKDLEQGLSKFNIHLERRPNYGIRVSGKEFDKRICIAAFYSTRFQKGNQSMDEIAILVSEVIRDSDLLISGAAYQNLIIHLYIAISRLMEQHCVPMPVEDLYDICSEGELEIAKKIASGLEHRFQIQIPPNEVAYIAVHLACKEMVRPSDTRNKNMIISQEISDLVTEMLKRIHEAFKLDFQEDLELRMNLCQHIVPLSARVRYGMDMKNPLLREVKEKFCLPYMIACNAVTVINDHYDVLLSEDEIAYFAFAFALALERQKTEIQKKNVLLVCASGRGSARLLQYKYQTMFGPYLNELTACDVGSLYKIDFSKYDYIFTTVPIPVKVPIPIQKVEYFLSDQEQARIRKVLDQIHKSSVEQYFPEPLFLPHLTCRNKDEALEYMCRFVIKARNLPDKFYASVLKREKLAQTAFGNMVAMPHSYEAMSQETFVCIGILDEPIDWGNQKVQVIFLVSIANKDITSDELQQFYQLTASYLLSQKQIQDLIRKQNYQKFLEAMEELESQIAGKE